MFQIGQKKIISRLKRLSLIEATLDTTFIFFLLSSSREVFLRFFEIWFKMILYVPNSSYEWLGMVAYSFVWFCVVLRGFAWFCVVSHGFA